MKKRNNSREWLMLVAGLMIFAGAFLVGMGVQKVVQNQAIRKEYQASALKWKRELADGAEEEEVRDLRNRELLYNLQYITMEQEIFLEHGAAKGRAGISNDAQSIFGCMITLIRDATGEVIYQSDLIEPGYYLEYIRLESSLQKGYYPCTAVLDFYTEDDEYVGETAWKIVVVIKN